MVVEPPQHVAWECFNRQKFIRKLIAIYGYTIFLVIHKRIGARGSVDGSGAVLQAGRSRAIEFFQFT
jgi:hypothetical protein